MKNMNKKGQTVAWVLIAVIVVGFIGVGAFLYNQSTPSTQSIVQGATAVADLQKAGKVASVGVFVRDLANDDVNSKIAVATYCMDDNGQFIIDGTTSSTTAEITGKTTVGSTITCYAFNSTVQTMKPSTIRVDGEVAHVVIDAYSVSVGGTVDFYDDTFTVADNGVANLSITSEGSDTYQKFKFTTTDSDEFYPLGGFYLNTVEDTNVSVIDFTGSATVGGVSGKSSTSIVDSALSTRVSARKSNWDFVFEIDDSDAVPGNSGNNPIILDENDFIESGVINVESDNSGGCANDELVSFNSFTKGYYRQSQGTGIGYGHENDATSGSVITADIDLDDFYCGA